LVIKDEHETKISPSPEHHALSPELLVIKDEHETKISPSPEHHALSPELLVIATPPADKREAKSVGRLAAEGRCVRIQRIHGEKWGLKLAPYEGRVHVTAVKPTDANELPVGTVVVAINDRDTAGMAKVDLSGILSDSTIMEFKMVVELPLESQSAETTEPDAGDVVHILRERGQRWGLRIVPESGRYKVSGVDVNGAADAVKAQLPVNTLILSIAGVDTSSISKTDLKNIVTNPDLLDLVVEVRRPPTPRHATAVEPDSQLSPSERAAALTGNLVRISRSKGEKWGLKMSPRDGRYTLSGVSDVGAAASFSDVLTAGTVIMEANGHDTATLAFADLKTMLMDRNLLRINLVVHRRNALQGTAPVAVPAALEAGPPPDVVGNVVNMRRVKGQKWGLKMVPKGERYIIVGVDLSGAAAPQKQALPPGTLVMTINGRDTAAISKTDFMALVRAPELLELDLTVTPPSAADN
jgi:hypothetical protein